MKNKNYAFLSLILFFLGFIFFLINNRWVFIVFSQSRSFRSNLFKKQEVPYNKKKVSLVYWHCDKWNTETSELLWPDSKQKKIQYLISTWLTFLLEENIVKKRVALQSVLISSNGKDCYLSFDRNPLHREASTLEKLMWIEGLLRTIRVNSIDIVNVKFLVYHKDMQDNHLDFSSLWPVLGFVED